MKKYIDEQETFTYDYVVNMIMGSYVILSSDCDEEGTTEDMVKETISSLDKSKKYYISGYGINCKLEEVQVDENGYFYEYNDDDE